MDTPTLRAGEPHLPENLGAEIDGRFPDIVFAFYFLHVDRRAQEQGLGL